MAGLLRKLFALPVIMLLMASCSVYKYVPEDEYLLNKVKIKVEEGKLENPSQYRTMSYQTPNTKWLGLFRIPLRIYSLSGKSKIDTDGKNLFRRMGEKPVILDTLLCRSSQYNMARALANKGYLKATVDKKIRHYNRPKADVSYILKPGTRYFVDSYEMYISDAAIDSLVKMHDKLNPSLVEPGMPLDASVLESERERIVNLLQMRGYYAFNKDNISFVADTVEGSNLASLSMHLKPFETDSAGNPQPYPVYTLDSVSYVLSETANLSDDILSRYSRIDIDGSSYYYYDHGNGKLRLRPKIIRSHSFLDSGRRYSSAAVSRTYSSLAQLSPVRYSNIRFEENADTRTLDVRVFMAPNPKYSFSAEVEGTNTAGDFGAAASVSLINRNLFGGAEQLTMTLRGAFEAITNLPGYSGNSYIEYGIEANLIFPEFLFPFINPDFQRSSQASSQLSIMLNVQKRPEFNKRVFTFGWSYLWSDRRHSHRFDLLSVNYLMVPWISETFRKEYLDPIGNRNSILRYNYEDNLIMRMGYSFYYSNARLKLNRPLTVSLRLSAETAGNLLYGISRLSHASVNEFGQYKFMDIAFAQYVKTDGSFTLNWRIDKWNNLLFHTEYGVAYPYSNSTTVPFEKRYYAGGANSVRGWAVRELGPGRYRGDMSAINYITQAGDIKLGASIELRSHLFWKLNAAFFVDAGNIWTIKEYDEQPGGCFDFNSFYRQIGVSYGAGIRLDLNFLVLRLDFGMQMVNPAYDSSEPERYPFLHHVDYRDYAFHFAVGYPF